MFWGAIKLELAPVHPDVLVDVPFALRNVAYVWRFGSGGWAVEETGGTAEEVFFETGAGRVLVFEGCFGGGGKRGGRMDCTYS